MRLSPSVRLAAALCLTAVALDGCSKPKPSAPVAAAAPPTHPATPYGAFVQVSLTPRAVARIAAIHEKVEVWGMYYGLPTPAGKAKADEEGQIDLGQERIDGDPAAAMDVTLPGKIDQTLLTDITAEGPYLLINVITARKTYPDNMLDCTIFEDTITKARSKPIQLTCDLIYPDSKGPAASSKTKGQTARPASPH